MSQLWTMPAGTTILSTAIKTNLVNALQSLRSQFAGSSAPSSTEAYMLWLDTSGTTNTLKQRNAADSAWLTVGVFGKDVGKSRQHVGEFASVAATFSTFVAPPHEGGKIKQIVLVATTASSSSSGNEWTFGLQNLTGAAALFSATVGTFTALGGVGGGEITANQVYTLIPDQNDDVSADDVLEFTMTKVGTVTTLVRLAIFIEWTMSEGA